MRPLTESDFDAVSALFRHMLLGKTSPPVATYRLRRNMVRRLKRSKALENISPATVQTQGRRGELELRESVLEAYNGHILATIARDLPRGLLHGLNSEFARYVIHPDGGRNFFVGSVPFAFKTFANSAELRHYTTRGAKILAPNDTT